MRKKKSAAPADSTPFFARYLEGQVGSGQTSAEVRSSRGGAYAKAKAKASAKAPRPPLMTLKYPSDKDEWTYAPYYGSTADVPEKYRDPIVTLKFPSDSDEHWYDASYLRKADVPTGKSKASGKVQLTKKALKRK